MTYFFLSLFSGAHFTGFTCSVKLLTHGQSLKQQIRTSHVLLSCTFIRLPDVKHRPSFFKMPRVRRIAFLKFLHLPFPGTPDSFSLHQVRAVSEASRVAQEDGEAADVQGRLHYVSCGPGNGRHDGCRSLAWIRKMVKV